MRGFWMLVALAGCSSDGAAVCGQGEWSGFACSEDVDEVAAEVDEVAEDVGEVADEVDDFAGDTGEQPGVVREYLEEFIELDQPYAQLEWSSVDVDEVLDLHLLLESPRLQGGDSVPVDGLTGCRVSTQGAAEALDWSDVWTGDVGVSGDGHPVYDIGERSVSVDCDEGEGFRVPIAEFTVVTLVVDWATPE